MEKTYHPQSIESHWTTFWEQHGFSQASNAGEPYCIMLPPPNVTGTLHMGHGFQHTLMDALIRRARMQGHKTLWQAGTDHAGIATQMVVERQLAQQGIDRLDLGREDFIEKVWEWREKSGKTITQQIRRMGASIDWSRERFSMDKDISHATYAAFIKLYESGLIYRGKRLVNWDPVLKTAISDLEVNTETKTGQLWHIRYPLASGQGYIVVATTRPETMLGDTAVAVHPEDERYQALIGKAIKLPLTEREIPIIADDQVEREFGTGCVKITPAHDFNDYQLGERHYLPMINIFTPDAKLNENTPKIYQGLSREDAREKIVEDLKTAGLIDKIEPHQLNIPVGDRSNAIIEPMLTDQWYVKATELTKPAIAAVETGKIQFVPETWNKTYLQWLYNIQDWCISRQLWWGHRIPVWYDQAGNHYVGFDESDARARYELHDDVVLTQDSDVLDTWFSAALWPFSSLGWPEQTKDLKTFYPTTVLVTGFDIIFFWVARMVMMGIKLAGDVPFKTVYITGLIRDSQGQKMSKSKGNILDPIDLVDGIELDALIQKRTAGLMQPQMAQSIEKATREEFPNGIASHGTDALRFTFCALATTGRDINFDMGRIDGYRNFCNKLWNAARYVILNTEQHDVSSKDIELSLADRWIRSCLQDTIAKVNASFDQYRFDLLAQTLYEFIWNQYCDWYLELSKCVLNDSHATSAQLRGTRYTLLDVLETLLRLIHPIMPYITEEIWQKVAPMINRGDSTIMLQSYPTEDSTIIDKQAQQDIEWLKQIVNDIRNIRGEMNISPSKKIPVIFHKGDKQDRERYSHCQPFIYSLAKVSNVSWHEKQTLPLSATSVVGSLEIHIPLENLIDKEAEISRLQKEIEKLNKECEKSTQKLGNPNFTQKAPPEVVSKERERLKLTEAALTKMRSQCEKLTYM